MIVDRRSAKLNLQRMRDMVVEYIGGLPFSGYLLDKMTIEVRGYFGHTSCGREYEWGIRECSVFDFPVHTVFSFLFHVCSMSPEFGCVAV